MVMVTVEGRRRRRKSFPLEFATNLLLALLARAGIWLCGGSRVGCPTDFPQGQGPLPVWQILLEGGTAEWTQEGTGFLEHLGNWEKGLPSLQRLLPPSRRHQEDWPPCRRDSPRSWSSASRGRRRARCRTCASCCSSLCNKNSLWALLVRD